ncbi:class I SAM-dependent methyltransferase [Pseudanabaena sp. FACHB-1998]|uniref:class I SAM-dependent methyltransferase n=1 Tax=Pseudanabaena sp. FACHB-1998 TaxID=2692858 RepID=UPI001681BAF3|nr:class I SAM-dependent methyltransferase [Pseudanabaena sp. FACHB-1998]MBD2177716.1 class I SAM-dependent methyltransferase [Pseudanabaena sp. FACHB-1998]
MHNEIEIHSCPACNSKKIKPIQNLSTLELTNYYSQISLSASTLLTEMISKGDIPSSIHIDKCSNCGLEFANPMFTAPSQWYSEIEDYGVREWDFQQCFQNLKPKSHVLEIGCGEGHFLDLAIKKGHSGMGLDFNYGAIEVAKSKGLEAYCWDLKELKKNLQERRFDAVVFFHVIEHVEDLSMFFEDLYPITTKDASLHFTCPAPNRWTMNLEEVKVGGREGWDYPPHHQTRWNKSASETILSRFGWQLQNYVEEPFDWFGLSNILAAKKLKKSGLELSNLSSFDRKIKIAKAMVRTFIPSITKTGMNMYCLANHK